MTAARRSKRPGKRGGIITRTRINTRLHCIGSTLLLGSQQFNLIPIYQVPRFAEFFSMTEHPEDGMTSSFIPYGNTFHHVQMPCSDVFFLLQHSEKGRSAEITCMEQVANCRIGKRSLCICLGVG
jgi:hypothetical protein